MLNRFRLRLSAPVDALPLDIFRVGLGLLSLGYLFNQIALAGAFTVPDGLLDHELIRRVFPFTRIGLFFPGLGAGFFYAALALGCLCALGIIAGRRVKLCAGVLFLITASLARWNFLVMQIDDTTLIICLVWLLLLPIGRTLTWDGWRQRGPAVWEEWLDARAPGLAVRCLMANVCLVYLIAGLLKLTSPYWRSGFALYASLRLPVAYFPDALGPADLPWLRLVTYLALAVEIFLPFFLLSPRGSRLKLAGIVFQIGFHAGIAATLAFPVANLALMATALLFYSRELADYLRRRAGRRTPSPGTPVPARAGRLAPVFLALLTVSALRDIPFMDRASSAATAALWVTGVYVNYSLFDWIDSKNVRGEPEATWLPPEGPAQSVDIAGIFPNSMRSSLLQGYFIGDIVHGSLWIGVRYRDRPALRHSILQRAAARFCREQPLPGKVRVCANVRRITPENADLRRNDRKLLMDFECADGGAPRVRAYVAGPFLPPCPEPAWRGPYVPTQAIFPPES